MTELIRMSAEQMRRNAEQRYKEKDIKEQKNRVFERTLNDTMRIDIAKMRNSKNEKKISNYLSDDVALEELESTLTHYAMIRMKERVLDFVKKITREDPNAYTIRTAAEFVSDYTNEYNVSNDIKQK
ncbi:hypothetical protein OA976_01685 [Candidatus Pelagibacter sp.]|nr:hypothetical protein [Candidatus Pelagibacter sp.]|tara:strand:- start:1604 stop:1984 length:381 start_codon:yes stop_codon:yes gene_type:complete